MSFLLDWIQTGGLNINSGPEIFQQERGFSLDETEKTSSPIVEEPHWSFWQVLKWRKQTVASTLDHSSRS